MVGEAVASVLRQGFGDFEAIVVDDGSSDETVRELARFPRRFTLVTTHRRGAAAARNAGVQRSSGRFIAFLDSDDLWLPRKLIVQSSFMIENAAVEICQTEEIWIRNGVRVNPKTVHRKPAGDIFLRSLERCLVSPSAVMMSRALFDKLGGFDESMPVCEDYDLWLRIAVDHRIALLPEPLTIKRGGHMDQLSRSVWGMDRYRVRALQKLLRNGLRGFRRDATLNVLRRKAGILAAGARKRGKLSEAAAYESISNEFEPERSDERSGDSRVCPNQGISFANA